MSAGSTAPSAPPDGVLPLVTVMIPTYRQSDLVLRAIDGALMQDYPRLEIVVSDDASPDDCVTRLAERSDPRLIIHRSRVNRGRVGNYRHLLYRLAHGEWVVNLDGDDFFTDPAFISKAIALAMKDREIVIVSARIAVRTAGSEYETRNPGPAIVCGTQVVLDFHREEFRFAHLATLYRRSLAMESDFYRTNALSSDWESLCRLALRGKVAYLDTVAAVWDVGMNSASSTVDWREWRLNLDIWKGVASALLDRGLPERRVSLAMRRIMGTFALQYLRIILRSRPRDALRFWWSLRTLSRPIMVNMFFNSRS